MDFFHPKTGKQVFVGQEDSLFGSLDVFVDEIGNRLHGLKRADTEQWATLRGIHCRRAATALRDLAISMSGMGGPEDEAIRNNSIALATILRERQKGFMDKSARSL